MWLGQLLRRWRLRFTLATLCNNQNAWHHRKLRTPRYPLISR